MKNKNDTKLLKHALKLGLAFATQQGYRASESSISSKNKVEVVYRLMVQYKQIAPLAVDKEDGPNMKHKLILWITRLLPEDHELLQ
ncbi:MAG: DUF5062 family protein [Aliivibrio sp.]|uniref:DUF5062 family protein n=1 Tax=Aliivibrio sp. TaxID=1872443 RepID=UPI001A515E2C|nr:DUF5062 family protein [Aliivibrio sp.]